MCLRIDFNLFKQPTTSLSGGGAMQQTAFASDSRILEDVLLLVEKKQSVFWVSEGEWSMHQMLIAILQITGPANVTISSYAMGETPARILAKLKQESKILKLSCVLDSRVETRTASSLQLMKGICDELKLIATHAKVTLIENDIWKITVIGSANYTENKRFESGIVTSDEYAFELNNNWISKALKNEP